VEVYTLSACLTPQAGSRRFYSYPCKKQGFGDTFPFAPVPTPRLHKADRPSTGAIFPAYSVVQRPYGRCSPTVPFTAFCLFFTPCGVGSGENSFSNLTTVSGSTPLRGVGLYPALKNGGFRINFALILSFSRGRYSALRKPLFAINITGSNQAYRSLNK